MHHSMLTMHTMHTMLTMLTMLTMRTMLTFKGLPSAEAFAGAESVANASTLIVRCRGGEAPLHFPPIMRMGRGVQATTEADGSTLDASHYSLLSSMLQVLRTLCACIMCMYYTSSHRQWV
jgi:hypothetical protein